METIDTTIDETMAIDLLGLVKRKEWSKVISRSKIATPSEMLRRDATSFNQTCLHIALTLNPPVGVVESLLECANGQQAAKMKEECNGYIPLHCAIRYESSLEVISLLVNAYKEGVSVKDKNQWSSIHLASYFNSSSSVVDLLLATDPSIARMKTRQLATPLHIACRRKANRGTIKSLLRAYPDAAKGNLKGAWSPLHLAIWHEFPDEVLIDLISACPEAATTFTSSSKQSPLGLYWKNKVISPKIVSYLIDPSVLTRDSKEHDCGIIHKVLRFPQRIPNLMTYVLHEFKDDAKCYDNEGRLPLHVAIERRRYVGKSTWKRIFRRYPKAIMEPEGKNSMYPFMMASVSSDLKLTYELIRLAPDILEYIMK